MKKRQLSLWCLSFILLFQLPFLQSCRHGDEDPFLSIYTRNNRLQGEWLLQNYTLDQSEDHDTSTTFSSTQCDTSSVGGQINVKISRQDAFSDSLLTSVITNTSSSIGNTKVYDVIFGYRIVIDKNGTYQCDGTYSYYSTEEGAEIKGSFSSTQNSWYWENSIKTKWSVSFLNFPLIDFENMDNTSIPITFTEVQTFDLERLTRNDLHFIFETSENSNIKKEFEAYTVEVSPDNIVDNCIKRQNITYKFEGTSEWTFKKKETE
ncbi:MAG: hypothetical protein ACPG5B_03315 [Chitinophagales bacterium]